jgi:hypothetical protein
MKRYLHKPKAKDLEEFRDRVRSSYQSTLDGVSEALETRNESWFFSGWQKATDLAELEYGLDGSLSDVRKLHVASCEHA